jgi:hypothetical protein
LWCAFGLLAVFSLSEAADSAGSAAKTSIPSARLLLPLYEVDTTDLSGTTTLFALRNQGNTPLDVTIEYFEADGPQAPFHSENLNLASREVKTFNVRGAPGLDPEADGFARGFVMIESMTEGARLMGDTFQLTPNQDFGSGTRLLNIAPSSSHNDLCNTFSMRFLNGGGFDSGTTYIVWVDLPSPPALGDPIFSINAWGEDGSLLLNREFQGDKVAFQVTAEDLLAPTVNTNFGAIDFQFSNDAVGHISAVLSASGRYSVGYEATCTDS